MASGCIMGECPVCGELIWEDDWIICNDKLMHAGCRKKYIMNLSGMDEAQYLRMIQASDLRKDIKALRELLQENTKYWEQQLERLELELEAVTAKSNQDRREICK